MIKERKVEYKGKEYIISIDWRHNQAELRIKNELGRIIYDEDWLDYYHLFGKFSDNNFIKDMIILMVDTAKL